MRPTNPILLVDPLIGAQVGEYLVDGVIGEGGMGVVYRGKHPIIGKQVAIKVLKESLAKKSGLTQRLVEEAKAVNAIAHRNIIDIFGLGELPDGRPYIVMEQLSGEPLDAFLQREGRLGDRAAADLLLELCLPLEAAHRAGIVHRDLKPGNVFLCDAGDGSARFLKLLDFGLARRTGGFGQSTSQTNRAFIVGTPNYLAPEQANGGDISDRTDVYALGIMLFEFLTGAVPFTGTNGLEVAMAHVRKPAPRVSSLVATVSPKLDDLVARMLAKQPTERPSVEEVRRLLAPNAPQRSAPVPRPNDTSRTERPLTVQLLRPEESSGSKTWLVAGGVALVVIAGATAALLTIPRSPVGERVGERGDAGTLTVEPSPRPKPTAVLTPEPTAADAGAAPELAVPTPDAGAAPELAAPAPDGGASLPVAVRPTPKPPDHRRPKPEPVRQLSAPASTPAPTASAPTRAQLVERIGALKAKLTAQGGGTPDPSMMHLLGTYSLKAQMASTPADFLEVAHKLDAFDQSLR